MDIKTFSTAEYYQTVTYNNEKAEEDLAILIGADLTQVKFQKQISGWGNKLNLSGVILARNYLCECNFGGCKLIRANLEEADLYLSNLSQCDLSKAL